MVVLVTGDRWWWDYQLILRTIHSWHADNPITLLVHGACRGADLMADRAADYLDIPCDPMPAEWDKHGPSAGPQRNRMMLYKHPEIRLVVAFHDSIWNSKGTKDMVSVAIRKDVPVNLVSHEDDVFPLTKDYFKAIQNSLDSTGSRA